MDCLFCKIAKKEIPSDIVYEDDNTMAFLDVAPIAPGHVIVIPKFHAVTILDIPDEKISSVFKTVKAMVKVIENALNPDGFTLGINHGKDAGQSIGHFHFHIIPRWKGDGGRSIHGVVDNKPKEPNEEILKKIKEKVEN